jgi:hypothetical protein
MRNIHAIVALSALAIACGGNSPATSHNNPGTGSSTLKVTGDIDGSISSGSPLTSFAVTVKDGAGNNVSGATVVVLNPSLSNGGVTLVEATPASGRYTNAVAQFPSGDFQLSVTHPSGNVQGVVVGGPGMHTINAPTINSTMPANQPLAVSWTTPTQAKQATVETRDLNAVSAPDTGMFTIAATQNPPNASQRLFVERFNEVDAAGGLAGSRLRVTFTASVDPFVVQ